MLKQKQAPTGGRCLTPAREGTGFDILFILQIGPYQDRVCAVRGVILDRHAAGNFCLRVSGTEGRFQFSVLVS